MDEAEAARAPTRRMGRGCHRDWLQLRRSLSPVYEKFASIDRRFDSIDARFASIDDRFLSLESRLGSIESEIRARRRGSWSRR